jgi:hypothetical protein
MTLDELLAWQPYKVFEMDSWLMSIQETCGIGFDIEGAKALVLRIDREMTEIASEIEPQLPPRPLNKGEVDSWRIPAKPWKKDGTLASSMVKWMERVGARYVGVEYTEHPSVLLDGKMYPIVGGSPTKTHGPMRLANQSDLKDWLIREGWVPTLWNLKKDERGKPVRDDKGQVIQTTPKMQDQGRLCPNLEELAGELVKPVVRWCSLRNRKSVIEGWLENKRLAWDGRLGAGASSITPTFRKTHAVVANLPKADGKVTLGVEIRSLFRAARPGYVFVGYDASGLEARVEAHYTYNYPGGKEYAHELIDGDIHTNTAVKMFAEQLAHLAPEDIHKDHPDIKPLRNKAKTLKYAASYGASAKKIASTLGIPEREGEEIFNAFWEAAAPLATLKERLTAHWEQNGKKWIRGLDGRRISTRSKHSLVNSLFQSAGALIFSYAGLFMAKRLGGLTHRDEAGTLCFLYKGRPVYRVAEYHDENVYEVPEELAEEIKELGERSLSEAGKYLKVNVPILGDGKIGMTWSCIH